MSDHSVGKASRGSTTSEYMLILSVVVVAVIAVASTFLSGFSLGVLELGKDVKALLSGDSALSGPLGGGAPGGGGGLPGSGSGPIPPGSGNGGGGDGGGTDDGGTDEGDGGGDTGGGDGDSGSGDSGDTEEEEPAECPYVYDEASERWRDPETGQYVSGAAAEAAGC